MTLSNLQSLTWFWPESILVVGILALLLIDLIAGASPRRSAGITLAVLGAAAAVTVARLGHTFFLFGGLLTHDPFTDFFRLFFFATTAISTVAALRETADTAEFFALLLTATLGMCLMAAAADLLMAFLGLETVSIASYLLAGFRRRSRASAEAALKYVIYGGVASGVMLYGMSLLYGLAAGTSFAAVRAAAHPSTTVVLAIVLCLAGFGYKLASVPFHMWCPDVYEGAPTPVTAFFSVGPKAAAIALLVRFLGVVPPQPLLLAVLAASTMTLGNLTALWQSNLKRLLAWSSIAHAGYLLLGLVAGGREGTSAILLYLVTYLFMNLGAFIVVLAVADAGVPEELGAWRGLGRRAPGAALAMALFLFSLTGLPPFAGFFGKYFIFAALIARGGTLMITLAVLGVLNSALSLFYYARVLKAMYFERPADEGAPLQVWPVHAGTMWALAIPTVALFIVWSPLMDLVDRSLP